MERDFTRLITSTSDEWKDAVMLGWGVPLPVPSAHLVWSCWWPADRETVELPTPRGGLDGIGSTRSCDGVGSPASCVGA